MELGDYFAALCMLTGIVLFLQDVERERKANSPKTDSGYLCILKINP